jgi:hypothetical protein
MKNVKKEREKERIKKNEILKKWKEIYKIISL